MIVDLRFKVDMETCYVRFIEGQLSDQLLQIGSQLLEYSIINKGGCKGPAVSTMDRFAGEL
jgi:hypothetical protein